MKGGRPVLRNRVDPDGVDQPFSIVVCCSDHALLDSNLLASPRFGPGSLHEVNVLKNAPNAAGGLNVGLERACNDLVVCVHQDVYLPAGWDRLRPK
jgi:hypothetical protein